MDRKGIEDAQRKLEWAIESLNLSIKCIVIGHKDEKYKVQFFTWENKLIRATGFNISEKWIGYTNPMKEDIQDELRSLLVDLEQEAKIKEEAQSKKKGLNSNVKVFFSNKTSRSDGEAGESGDEQKKKEN